MKKVIIMSAAAVAGLFTAGFAAGQTITSIQFASSNTSQQLTSTDVAGIDGTEDNWNVVNVGQAIYYNAPQQAITNSASSGLVTSTGAASSVGYSITSGGSGGGNSNQMTGSDYTLLSS